MNTRQNFLIFFMEKRVSFLSPFNNGDNRRNLIKIDAQKHPPVFVLKLVQPQIKNIFIF